MEKRTQTIVSVALGILAVLLLACVVLRFYAGRPADAAALSPAALPAASHYDLMDLNTASAEELTALPGIGEILAERIVRQREENGPFLTREDVLAVSGIGEKTYEAMEPFITY